MSVTEAVV